MTSIPSQSDQLRWEACEVLRDVDRHPQLFTRIKLSGDYFPQRALEPVMYVGNVRSALVEIDADGMSARAYFDKSLPERGRVTFGYGDEVTLSCPAEWDRESIVRLDRTRIPRNTRLPEE